MEAIAALLGLGVAVAAPFVPGLRPVAKAVVKGGMAVADASVTVATFVAEEVSDLAAHVRAGHGDDVGDTGAEEAAAEAVEAEATEVAAEEAAESATAQATGGATIVAATSAGLRPVSKAAVKGGLAVADAAKTAAGVAAGAAVVAGKQVGGLAATIRPGKAAGEAEAETVEAEPEAEAAPPVSHELIDVAGVGPKTVTLLQEAGITTVAQLAATPVERLKEILEQAGPRYRIIDPGAWPANAQALLDAPPPQPIPFDDSNLVQIEGVGPKTAGLLRDAGLTTVSQLAATPVEQLRAILEQAGPRYRIVDPSAWPQRAQALLPSS